MVSERYPAGTRIVIIADRHCDSFWARAQFDFDIDREYPVLAGMGGVLKSWGIHTTLPMDEKWELPDEMPRIELDNGDVIYGDECYWMLLSDVESLDVERDKLAQHIPTLRQMITGDGEVVLL